MSGAIEGIRFVTLQGPELEAALPELARLRITVFREWPYLYDGSLDYEQRYLRTYAATPGAVVIGALAGDRVVGAATALPLAGEPEAVVAPLREAGFDPATIFYLGESVLEPAWRGRGIGVRFFTLREAAARAQGFTRTVFCAVIRDQDDPRRPAGYTPLDGFWRNRGYTRLDGVTCGFSWREVGQPAETLQRMTYWTRVLPA